MRRMFLALSLMLAGCGDLSQVGKTPDFSPLEGGYQHHSLYSAKLPLSADSDTPGEASSLWSGQNTSLLGDRRAAQRGDILTVVVQIDDKAEISNSSDRSRSGAISMGMPHMLGIPQRLDGALPEGASMAEAARTKSSTSFDGEGRVSRKEKLTLRIAATVVEELPNGVLRIEGQQEVRVNNELRELIVTGYVRPADISRQNEITYDKIAGARVSYGGRGQITEVQQPAYGQQIADIVLPF
ncbi:flagellar basal body L-ring protein FlgH [Xinfangfangia sp. CPCC 101601]|uniref:Flagellar L-ring protein n=1 Tax=Pseudogemmobacter lacusdianii TaxID=3069608 RepID=A0ABU0VWJ5_9RHOB|nr:flagellar basal body L-ring protein FlgH [Xinfangfangia sp. CPCC 101601]MDQ2065295.1 flagellar basal body L-ring protein FlgH [Xinfangfangia sp. CPCC 101601]